MRVRLSPASLILLSSGEAAPITNLGCAEQAEAWSIDERARICASSVASQMARNDSAVRMRTSSARVLIASPETCVLVGDEWVDLGSVRSDMRVAILRRLPEPRVPELWNDARLVLLGQMIGDGSFLLGSPMRYTTASEENSEAVTRSASEEFGATVRRYRGRRTWHQLLISGNGNRWKPAGVNAWFRELGIFGQRSHEKHIPSSVFRLSNRQIGLLLKHLWATDGTIAVRAEGEKGADAIAYNSNSERLARDVQRLLLRFEIVARFTRVSQGEYRPAFMVTIGGKAEQERFLQHVGAFGPRAPQATRLREKLLSRRANTNVDTVPWSFFRRLRVLAETQGLRMKDIARMRGVPCGLTQIENFSSRRMLLELGSLLGDELSIQRATSDLFWDRIASVERVEATALVECTTTGPVAVDGILCSERGTEYRAACPARRDGGLSLA